MTQAEFNRLLSQINALPPEQMRQLRQQIDTKLAHPQQPPSRPPRTTAKASGRK